MKKQLKKEEVKRVFDTGNTGFMLVATSLVMLMTPGLAFFYGGLVSRKNVLTIMMQSLYQWDGQPSCGLQLDLRCALVEISVE